MKGKNKKHNFFLSDAAIHSSPRRLQNQLHLSHGETQPLSSVQCPPHQNIARNSGSGFPARLPTNVSLTDQKALVNKWGCQGDNPALFLITAVIVTLNTRYLGMSKLSHFTLCTITFDLHLTTLPERSYSFRFPASCDCLVCPM